MSEKQKLCPIMKCACQKQECAWWYTEIRSLQSSNPVKDEHCAILQIAKETTAPRNYRF